MNVAGAILAGGKSSRMGENKALMPFGEKLVIEHIVKEMNRLTDELLLVVNDFSAFNFLELPIVSDRYKGKGPLAGLEAALFHLPDGYVAIAACDTPFLSAEVYRYLAGHAEGYQAVIPSYQERMHPLSGIYHTSILPQVRECLENDDLKIKLLLNKINYRVETSFADLPEYVLEQHFFNMNHQHEYVKALNSMEK